MAKWKSIAKNLYEDGRYVEAEEIARKLNAFDEMLFVLKDVHDFLRRSGYDTTLVKSVITKAEGK